MDKTQEILKIPWLSLCPICGKGREYTTKIGYQKGLNKPCKSCSNSMKLGGTAWDGLCVDCGKEKDYPKSSSLCKSCHNQRTLKYHKEIYRFKKYGITKEWYEEECKKGCAICKKHLDPYSGIKRERGHIDHDHETGKVRGILCDLCNKGLGQFKDSILYLEAAITYLSKDK